MSRVLSAVLVALVLSSLALFGVEHYWRGRGYAPVIMDSADFWSIQRARVYARDSRPLVFLGASRTLYAIDRETVLTRLPGYAPVMLARDGEYPLATLRDLAEDTSFNGVVICDLDAVAFSTLGIDMQRPMVDFYHQQFTPSRAMHRLLLSHWQRQSVLARPDFSLTRAVLRVWKQEPEPFHPFQWLNLRRFGFIDFSAGDPEPHRQELVRNLESFNGHFPRFPFDEWWPQVEASHGWVKAIQARGGEVIFYASPTSGLRRDAFEDWAPRAEYWDKMAAVSPAKVLNALDVPALRDFPLPDDSHVDYRQKPAYTHALIDALQTRGWLQTPH
ncbi:MAG: hypothetical protein IT475_07635 [Aquimonas sp.]|jgi:hypothetical protein|nr:hypothetical protein [Aquimonas sp.]